MDDIKEYKDTESLWIEKQQKLYEHGHRLLTDAQDKHEASSAACHTYSAHVADVIHKRCECHSAVKELITSS